jgi:hypothetical protein
MTLVDATQGNNYVTVDSISSEMPQSGWLALAKSKATITGIKNVSAGYDFKTDPRNFLIISGDGIEYETITLDQKCNNAQEIADLINAKLQQTMYATTVEAFVADQYFVGLRQKDPYWGEAFSFVLDYGSPDALTVLGIAPGTHVGVSDIYEYTSWSGTTIYISGTLDKSYQTGVYCACYYKELNVQEIYNAAMDWVDDPLGMAYDVPMEASGYYPLGGGAYTDKIYVLVNGWQILPHCGNYKLMLIGTLITDDGRSRIRLPRSGTVSVTFQVSSQGIIADIPEIDEIKAKTDNLPADPASESTVNLVRSELQAHDQALSSHAQALTTHDSRLSTHDADIKGPGWVDESLKAIKDAIDQLGTAEVVTPPRSIAQYLEKQISA